MVSRYLLEISYKGTVYSGWQVQKNTSNTIQQVVNEKLSVLLHEQVMVTASGRTDAGVHAFQNFAHFDLEKSLPEHFLRRLNFLLPVDIAVRNVFSVPGNFNARFAAISRTYEYLICYDKNPFLTDFTSFYPYPELSAEKLNEAADFLATQNDFAAFSKKRTQVKTTLCAIQSARWELEATQNLLRFRITADRFLRGMVRGLVATSIRYAREKLTMDQLSQLIESRQPHKTDFSAPAQGLTLLEVKYPDGLLVNIDD
ncbi:MAG: tRNA pseudouridine(38-40) synthase TruA [Chitinophagaceae bacterium]|nr:tRNA pseudouridine(38-40) synthase TruA [Chitinophagaceae bacterium]